MDAALTRWSGRLRSYSRILATVPSLVFGLLYLVSIFAFACVYAGAFGDEFYSATAKYEYLRSSAANAVLTDVRRAMVANFEAAHGSFESTSGPWRVNITAFDIEWPALTPEELHLVVRGSVWRAKPPNDWRVFTFPIDLSRIPMASRPGRGRRDIYVNVANGSPIEQLDTAFLFPCTDRAAATCLPVAGPAASRLERAREALLGFPNPYMYWTPSRFLRMLYFSAVTISTLGYGDIVPISTRARAVVTLEVIWGPILLGLFLNSLITEAAQGISSRRSASEDVLSALPPGDYASPEGIPSSRTNGRTRKRKKSRGRRPTSR